MTFNDEHGLPLTVRDARDAGAEQDGDAEGFSCLKPMRPRLASLG